MRGKVQIIRLLFRLHRITPAYAGKSIIVNRQTEKVGDHPRLCGEKSFSTASIRNFKGSPPPMRGKVYKYRKGKCSSGITPAYAGKRYHKRQNMGTTQDHPRLCGEKIMNHLPPQAFIGSPPPMRGKATQSYQRKLRAGITPAYAGKSTHKMNLFSPLQDHPRLCGEK